MTIPSWFPHIGLMRPQAVISQAEPVLPEHSTR